MTQNIQNQFQAIEAASFAGIVVHEDGVIREVNDKIGSISGYSAAELIGMDCLRLIAPQSRDFAGKTIMGDSYTIHGLLGMKKDGASFPLKIQGKTLSAEGRVMRVMEWYPMDNVMQVADPLWGNAEAIRFLVENTSDAVGQLDADLKIVYVNSAFEKISHGFKSAEVIGRPIFDFIAPSFVSKISQVNRMRLDAEASGIKTGAVRFETQALRKSGDYFWAEIIVNPYRDQQDRLIGYTGIIRDISQDKLNEAKRQRQEEEMKKTQKMSEVGHIAGVVAHDLNNVLSGILGYSELLLLQPEADPALTNQVKNIALSAERAASIVHDLSILTRREKRQQKVFTLNDLVTTCFNKPEFRRLSQHYSGINLHIDLEPGMASINGCLPQLEKTFCHLVSQALEAASGREAGRVCISTKALYLGRPDSSDESVREGEYAVLSVYDTGYGISGHDLPRIFEPFYSKKVLKRGQTGLELVVVRETVTECGGFIDVYSEPDAGTTFTIYFP
ncbi:MAG: PAS domain S-box protein, partial [Smithellaceae bacterium]